MPRIVVSGGCGYLGALLVPRLLAMGCDVTVVDNGWRGSRGGFAFCDSSNLTIRDLDVRDTKAMARVIISADVVVHLAAIVGEPACTRWAQLAAETNVEAVRALAVSLDPAQRLIFLSTADVLGPGASFGPKGHYAVGKYRAEQFAALHDNFMILRPSSLFGVSPSMRFDLFLHQMIWEAVTGETLNVYQPSFLRPIIHVEDVTRIVAELAVGSAYTPGSRVNLCNPNETRSKGALASDIAGILGRKVRVASGYIDPEARNYDLDVTAMRSLGLTARRSFASSVERIANACRLEAIAQRPKL